jgi:hypothetical protein
MNNDKNKHDDNSKSVRNTIQYKSKTLIETPIISIIKNGDNSLNIEFFIENPLIDLTTMLNFGLIKLIGDINKDIYEDVDLQIIDENNAYLRVVMKHLLKDLGIPQTYSNLLITKSSHINAKTNAKTVTFTAVKTNGENIAAQSSFTDKLELMPIPIQKLLFHFNIENAHKIKIQINILFEETATGSQLFNDFSDDCYEDFMDDSIARKPRLKMKSKPKNGVFEFVEKMLSMIIKNIVSRLKQFIENAR